MTDVSDQTEAAESVVIVGGCGRVGLPLGIALASVGYSVSLYDINADAVKTVSAGQMPFMEDGADHLLVELTGSGQLTATTDRSVTAAADHVIVVVGTPVDEHLNPDPRFVLRAIEDLLDVLADGQHLVLRSTVYPGVTAMVEQRLAQAGIDLDVTFCPERIAEGKAMTELFELPQIVSGRTPRAVERASAFFGRLTDHIVVLSVEEAELAKLFTNTWRYIKFAAANQLYMIANDFGLDYERIRAGLSEEYPRATDLPRAGLAAGPCLLKDTMQLAAFNNNNFTLGHASMTINEGLPLYLIAQVEQQHDLSTMTVGLLGMAFKAGSDDPRSSLSYKMKRLLRFKAAEVLCTDPFVTDDDDLVDLDVVLERADILIVAAPHAIYAEIETDTPIVDVWNIRDQGVRV